VAPQQALRDEVARLEGELKYLEIENTDLMEQMAGMNVRLSPEP
jgi:hypothetical protein